MESWKLIVSSINIPKCNLTIAFLVSHLCLFQDGTETGKKKKTFVPPPRFFNMDEAR